MGIRELYRPSAPQTRENLFTLIQEKIQPLPCQHLCFRWNYKKYFQTYAYVVILSLEKPSLIKNEQKYNKLKTLLKTISFTRNLLLYWWFYSGLTWIFRCKINIIICSCYYHSIWFYILIALYLHSWYGFIVLKSLIIHVKYCQYCNK